MNNIKEIANKAVEIYFNCNTDAKKSIELAKEIYIENSESKKGETNKMTRKYSEKERIEQNKQIEKLVEEGKTQKQIAEILKLSKNTVISRIYKHNLKSPRLRQLKEYERRRMTGYIPPKLDIGKEYLFAAKNVNGKIRTGTHSSRVKGKIIEEYKNFYRINRGKYIECMNKNDLMNYQIKAI